MSARRIALMLVLAALAAFGFAPAGAVEPGCTAAEGSATTPHFADATLDYNGPVTGNQGTTPYGEVYREGTDVVAGWISKTETGTYQANIDVASFSGLEWNAVFYFLFDWEGGQGGLTPPHTRRYVSAQIRQYAEGGGTFSYGYLNTTLPVAQLIREGFTTGSARTGTPGGVTVDIPLDKMAATPEQTAGPGDLLANPLAESRVLIGHPGHGQQSVTSNAAAGGGLVGVADDTANALAACFEIEL